MGWLEFVIGLLGVIVGGGGGFLFYRQREKALSIDNDSKLITEWEKLYREQKEISSINSEKIETLNIKILELTNEVEELKRERIYICYKNNCTDRIIKN